MRSPVNPPEDRPASPAEFDGYAQDYDAGMDNPLKGLLGDSADAFVAIKLHWLLRRCPEIQARDAVARVLDYGCGIATLLRLMAEAGVPALLSGCDISAGMLEQAAHRWPSHLAKPSLLVQNGASVPVASESFDLIVISAVLHHVALHERADVYAELHRLLRPGGRLVVFEHNPVNPVTRYVVAHSPIDQNAILLRAGEAVAGLRSVGFHAIGTEYLMFLPPRLMKLKAIEAGLWWLPLGAQYAVMAQRS